MKGYQTEQLRNVGLFSHGGAGKTSLSEAMLFNAGAVNRLGRVEEGTTVSDYDPDEIKRRISVQISLLPYEWRGIKVNLIDTPGYADFIGEVKEAARIVDSAVILLDAVAGIEVGTELVWGYCDEQGLHRLVFVNKIDRENANFQRVVDQLRARYGPRLVPVELPIGSEDNFQGVVDLVKMQAYIGPKAEESSLPTDLRELAAQYREKLVEAVAEMDDALIAKYLEGEELTEEEIRNALRLGTLTNKLVPVLCGSALTNKGIQPLMNAIADYLPSPTDRGEVKVTNLLTNETEPLPPLDRSPLAVLVFKTTADPYVGKLTYLRVYSGLLHSDSHVWNANKAREERIGQLFILRGKSQEPVVQLGAGEIGAVAKLQETSTNDTLCSKDRPLQLPPIVFPQPVYAAAVEPKTKADLDKLGTSLSRLAEEDPTIRVYKEPDTNETIISGMGESHVEIAAEKMRRKLGVEVTLSTPKVPYKETIQTATRAEWKHKKQTGGHGQYGHVFLEIEPLPRGSGFEFTERVVGGVVPKQYIPGVEKGVCEAITEGILAGYPVVDIKVTLYDGSYHPVDSSEISFKIAAAQAFKKGLGQASPTLLEPIMNVTIVIPEQYTGDVMSDLNSKRARVLGMEPQGSLTLIRAQAPLAEMQRYATILRSITQGRGTYSMDFSHYEEVPVHIAPIIINEAKNRQKE
ncbi:MAG: elongation factor G [Chloroflexi bacterium]|nr:elongation factor G [Chloroflexota bacterium]MCL5075423.1 elongation factor G [Chloroflexota bacterium]